MNTYEEKYNEALEKAKYYHDRDNIQFLENIFPELKESEDERIRKMLIEFFGKGAEYNGSTNGISDKEVLAWLEKQGEKEHQYKSRPRYVGEDELIGANKQGEKNPVEEIKGVFHKWYICIEGVENFSKGCLYKSNIDDQGTEWITDDTEHSFVYGYYLRYFRPATEEEIPHEPKFKVGDWVVTDKCDTVQIGAVNNGYYTLYNGMIFNVSYVDKCWHLWTIADARDGNVLALSYASHNYILIYKRLYEKGFNTIMSVYCFYCVEENEYYDGTDNFHIMNRGEIITPATKEQRDTLFTKVHKAGYEWDAEKKELKKIEPFGKYEGLTDFERTLADICIGWIGEEYGWKQYIKDNADALLKIAVKKFNSVQDVPFEQNPAWSEGDEKYFKNVIDELVYLRNRNDRKYDYSEMTRLINWLKDLKDRVQPQTTWKPSREQIMALRWVLNHIPYDSHKEEISGLLEQLKKLREE